MSYPERLEEFVKLKKGARALGLPFRGQTEKQIKSFIESKVGDIPIPEWISPKEKQFSINVEKNVDRFVVEGNTIHFHQKTSPVSESVGHIEIRDMPVEIDPSIKDQIQCTEEEILPTMPSAHCVLPNRKLSIIIVSQYGKTSESWERSYGGKVFIRESKPSDGETQLEM